MDLSFLWSDQYDLQQLWHDWTALSKLERDGLIKELLLNLHEQVGKLQDVADHSRYHMLKQSIRAGQSTAACDAGVGVMKLLVALMLFSGVTPEQFAQTWSAVGDRVRAKWRWEQDQLADVTVLACDLDGVVSRYTPGFRSWCEQNGHTIGGPHINTPDMEPIKDQFHSSGGFSLLEPDAYGIEVLNRWRGLSDDRRLVMITARPYRQFKRIYSDTIDWLRRVGLNYDHVLFERDKAEAIRLLQPARIVGHIEDRGKHALEVAATGTRVFKLPFDAPEELASHPLITLVSDWDALVPHLEFPDAHDRLRER